MTHYNTLSPEELSELHKRRMEEVQSIMNKIVTDPSEISVKDLTKLSIILTLLPKMTEEQMILLECLADDEELEEWERKRKNTM
jgi:hypothetical protein